MSATPTAPFPTQAHQGRYLVRSIGPADFGHLQRLEQEIWGHDAAGQLCPHYLRLCTDVFPEWSFLALEEDRPVAYVLNFPKGRTAFCATLAVHPDHQKGKASYLLIRAMICKLLEEDIEECRFLVEPDNQEARRVHATLGARVVGEHRDFYRPGDHRLVSVIDRQDLDRIRHRYERLKLVS